LTGQGEVDSIGNEAVLGGDIGEKWFQLAEREVDGLSAGLAHEMVVARLAAQMKHARPVTEMDMVEESETLQHIDSAIDRGLIDR
jgi:hypothetical protein